MNYRLVFKIIGRLLEAMSLFMLLPMIVSLIYGEPSFSAFLISALISFGLGEAVRFLLPAGSSSMYAKEGFVIVALAWLTASLIGTLPFVISGEIPSFVDAFFETVSGFTTTGASILTDVESLSHGMLFWRSFTHWIGGMGVLVFLVAFVSNIAERSIHILRAEMPGPIVGKLVPRSSDTSKVLYIIYIGMSVLQIIMLTCGGMPLFESFIHTFGTAGTGGFGMKADSVGGYTPFIQWTIAIFMLVFGVNFNLYYLLLTKRFKSAYKSLELWVYLGLVAGASLLITLNIMPLFPSLGDAVRNAVFQVSSIATTTGFSTVDFDLWPSFSKTIIFILMMIGACAGSTAGGLKVSRVVILFKMIAMAVRRMIHPRAVTSVKIDGKELDSVTQNSVTMYFAVYIICILLFFLLISSEPFDFETNFSAVVSCFNNIGPGFGAVGPMYSYAAYSPFSKILLSAAMLMGRLEIFPLMIAMIPSTWKRR